MDLLDVDFLQDVLVAIESKDNIQYNNEEYGINSKSKYNNSSISQESSVVQRSNLLNNSIETFENSNTIKNPIKIDDLPQLDGYSSNENYIYGKYLEDKDANIIIDNSSNKTCCLKHNHDNYKCTYGETNYPNPDTLNDTDRNIFKLNYQDNTTLQDYINWLYLYSDDESSLSYEHYKFYDRLKKGKPLIYIKGICPPSAKKINKSNDSIEYYKNLYGDLENGNFSKLIKESKLDITKPHNLRGVTEQIKDATQIHGKQLKGYNYLAYTRLDKYNKIKE